MERVPFPSIIPARPLILNSPSLSCRTSNQGRAKDVLHVFGYRTGESLSLNLGYRIIEGVVDNGDF